MILNNSLFCDIIILQLNLLPSAEGAGRDSLTAGLLSLTRNLEAQNPKT